MRPRLGEPPWGAHVTARVPLRVRRRAQAVEVGQPEVFAQRFLPWPLPTQSLCDETLVRRHHPRRTAGRLGLVEWLRGASLHAHLAAETELVDTEARHLVEARFTERAHVVHTLAAVGEKEQAVEGEIECVRRLPHAIADLRDACAARDELLQLTRELSDEVLVLGVATE